ncbi:PREDICTED: rRNA-processing protein fcf2 [Tarenaya hassleriana]|uniref:rRNA-processing protein fcf2 n=1 Tax=Tarenaya hassleriana TaxID=28532 RepID=UPI00053C301D|nr:PREDICTED: rRNA-processing protein fcf2 [Tarenaya hassleriana]
MAESKPVIGLTWEPKLPDLSSVTKTGPGSGNTARSHGESSLLWKPASELVDGFCLPPNDPKKLNRMLRKQVQDTAGSSWFDMPAPTMTPELKRDLQLLKMRSVVDPKRHYKKGDSNLKSLPKYFQVGTVIEPSVEFYSTRLTKKERKSSITEELLSDPTVSQYRKRKVREIEETKRPVHSKKWKGKGKQSKQTRR